MVYKILVEIPNKWEVIFVFKIGKFQRGGGGGLQEILPGLGTWLSLELHMNSLFENGNVVICHALMIF